MSPSLVPFGVCGASSAVSTPGPGGVSKGPCRHCYCTRGLGARLLTGSATDMWREAFHREPLLMKSPSRPAGLSRRSPALSSLPWSSSTARPLPALGARLPSPPVMPSPTDTVKTVSPPDFSQQRSNAPSLLLKRNKAKNLLIPLSHQRLPVSLLHFSVQLLERIVLSCVFTLLHSHSNPLQSGFCPNAPSKPCLLMTPVLVLTGLHHCSEHSRGPLFPAVLRATVHTALQPLPLPLCPPTFLPRAASAAATPGTGWPFKAHSHPALLSGTLPPDGSLPHCLQVEQEDSRPWPPVADLAPRAGPWYSPPAHKQFTEHQCPDKTTL